MKFFSLIALVAAVSAIKISDPSASAKARESTLATSRTVVATQDKFAADHLATHV